jgi:hypothetical protein
MNLNITHRQIIADVPSASGIEISGNAMYVIGDNSPWLYKLNEAGELVDRFQIYALKNTAENIIPKSIKPDFEAMTMITEAGKHHFYIFGSASKSPHREVLVKGTLDEPDHWSQHNLSVFFNKIKEHCHLADAELNIEAAVAASNCMYLFNRGKNCIIQFSITAFDAFIAGKECTLIFKKTDVELPKMNAIQSGFSGAALIPEQDKIIFTASAENTTNWIDDGEISGSYVGIIDLKNGNVMQYTPITENGIVLPLKIESVAIKSASDHKIEIVFVTDQDGGLSELIYAELLF